MTALYLEAARAAPRHAERATWCIMLRLLFVFGGATGVFCLHYILRKIAVRGSIFCASRYSCAVSRVVELTTVDLHAEPRQGKANARPAPVPCPKSRVEKSRAKRKTKVYHSLGTLLGKF